MIISIVAIFLFMTTISPVNANNSLTQVDGMSYESHDSKFDFNYEEYDGEIKKVNSTYGSLTLNGDVKNISDYNKVTSYGVSGGKLSFTYSYSDALLKAKESKWHLIDNNDDAIGNIELDSDIDKGALVLLASRDGKDWAVEKAVTNMFEDKPVNTEKIYTCKDIQLTNGTFYKLLIAYEVEMKTGEKKVLFMNKGSYDTKKIVEVFSFHAYDIDTFKNPKNTTDYTLTNSNDKINTGSDDNGYSGNKAIDQDDLHYGWEIGTFHITDSSFAVHN